MKHFLLICDGMAEEPLEVLGGRTPQQAADTPNMDLLASMGTTGLLQNCPPGFPPGSDTAILTILGYDPASIYTGRAALEAADLGIPLASGETAFRGNLVGLLDGKIHSHCGADGENALHCAKKLVQDPVFAEILEQNGCSMTPLPSFRQLLITPGFSGLTYAPHDHLGEPLEGILPENSCLRALTLRSVEVLKEEGLALCFWGPGSAMVLPPFPRKGTLISATAVCRGIGILAGLEVPRVPGATGGTDTDYGAKARAVLSAFGPGIDFVAAHVEAPDTCAHLRDPLQKTEAISRIDRLLLGPVLAGLEKGSEPYRVLILSDHETSCRTGRHTAAPVPYICFDSQGMIPEGTTAMEILFGVRQPQIG